MRDFKRLLSSKGFMTICLQLLLCTISIGQSTLAITPEPSNDTLLLCIPSDNVATFEINGGSGSYSWSFPGGLPSSATGSGPHVVTYSSTGLYNASITAPSDTLMDGRQITVIVGSPTSISFTPSDMLFCDSDPIYTIDGTFPSGGYFKGPGISGGTFNPGVAGVGSHTITYYYQNGGCIDSASQTFEVKTTPNTELLAAGTSVVFNGTHTYSRCLPANSTFNFYSPTDTSTYTSFSINFGDGSAPVTGSNFPAFLSHSYPNIGGYTVVLTMYGDNGCPSYDTVKVFFGSNPSVGLNISGSNIGCLPKDSSGVAFSFPITNYQSNPPGTIYIVEANDGSAPQIFNHPPPDSIVHIFYASSCDFNTVNFTNAFQIRITAQTPCQPHSVATVEPIYISEPPNAAFEMQQTACVGDNVTLRDSSWGSKNSVSNCDTSRLMTWDISPSTYTINSGSTGYHFNDPYAANWVPGSENLSVSFNSPGVYTIRQFVGNLAGCETDTAIRTICVDEAPDAGFNLTTSDTICIGDTIRGYYLNDIYSACDTLDVQWSITPPNNGYTVSTNPNDSTFEVYFNKAGNYTVRVSVSNNCGNDTYTQNVTILDVPDLDMPANEVFCGLRTIDFSNSRWAPAAVDSSGTGLSQYWQVSPDTGWSYVNGTDSTSQYPVIDFTSHGSYKIAVTASNQCGSVVDTMTLTFTNSPILSNLPDVTVACYDGSYGVRATATGGTAPYTWVWNTNNGGNGNGNGNGNNKPKSTTDSIYLDDITSSTTVTVVVTDANGCSDTVTFNINVNSPLSVDAGSNQTICYTDSVTLNGSISGGNPPYSYYWSPGSLLSDSTILNPSTYPSDSTITYTLTVTDSLGCTRSENVTINITPIITLDAGPDTTVCYGNLWPLNSQSHNGGTWSGPGVSGNNFDPNVAGLGTHTLYYNYVDAGGCPYVDSLVITVIDGPIANFSLSDIAGCSVLQTTAYDSSSAGVSYNWYVNGVLSSTSANPTFNLGNNSHNQDSIYTIKLIVTSATGCQDSIEQTVTVYPIPLADIDAPTVICANDTVQFLNASIFKNPAFYQWYAPSSVWISNDTVAQPFFGFPDNQSGTDSTYTIGLIVTSADGCIDTVEENITIHSRPAANFTMPANACAPAGISPIDASTGTGLNYSWSVNPSVSITNGNTSNPTFNFPSVAQDSSIYTISLQVTDANGCIDTVKANYVLYAAPTAAFTPAVNDSCGPMVVTFNNLSTSNLSNEFLKDLTFNWDFGNGQTSTDSIPTSTFVNNGTTDTSFYVTLVVTNRYGCSDTVVDTITVHPDAEAQINAAYWAGCAPFLIDSSLVNATAYAQANLTYIWQITDMQGNVLDNDTGLTSINYTIINDGDSVLLNLIAIGPYGCNSDTATSMFYTIGNPVANFSLAPSEGCTPLTIQITDSSTSGVSRDWYANGVYFSSLTHPTATFVNTGSTDSIIEIKLFIMSGSGCVDSASATIVVHPEPDAEFSIPSVMCSGDTLWPINLSAGGAGIDYEWSVNSPTVIISNDTAFSPYFVFPDIYSGPDSTYSITLISLSGDGCSDTVTHDVTIQSRPVAAFTLPASACGSATLQPADSSSGVGISYNWSISPSVPGSGLTTATPQFNVPVSTNDSVQYTVSLVVTNTNGCTDSATDTYTAYPLPTAGFTISVADTCGTYAAKFTNTSSPNQTGMGLGDLTFYWNFGNGQASTDSVPSTNYLNLGTTDTTYHISLFVTNAFGCTDIYHDSIIIHPDPVAEMDVNNLMSCAPFTIDSNAVTAVLYPYINSQYTWEVLDMSGNVLGTYTGANAINYTIIQPNDSVVVRLIAESIFGCKNDTVERTFYTINNPVAAFSVAPDNGCSPLTVQVTDSVLSGINREWYVNGVPAGNAANPSFTFFNNGTTDSIITIKLIVQAGTGCRDSVERQVTVYPAPVADFDFPLATSCSADTVMMNNLSTGNGPMTYEWSSASNVWISNATDSVPNFVFPVNQTGYDSTYTVTLVVYSSNGCTDTVSNDITIPSSPVADFTLPATACGAMIITPADSSLGNGLSYSWTISPAVTASGDTTASPQFTIPVSTNDSVVYTITLTVTDTNGCFDTISKTYTNYPVPTAGFALSTNDTCGPYVAIFTNTSTPNQAGMGLGDMTFLWDLGNGQTSTDSVPTVTYQNNGTADTSYVISLIATNAFGCSDTITDTLVIRANPIAELDTTTLVSCAPFVIDSSVVAAVQYPAINGQYIWEVLDMNGNVLSTFNGANAVNYTIAQPLDSVEIRLIATSLFGCSDDTVSAIFRTIENPNPAFSVTPDEGCSPLTVQVNDSAQAGVNRQWYINGIAAGTTANPSFTFVNNSYVNDSIITIKLVVEAGTGCKDSSEQQVIVHPKPLADYTIPAISVCGADTIYMTNQSIGAAPLTYSWSTTPSTVFITNANDANPGFVFPVNHSGFDSTYSVTLITYSAYGCSDTITQSITIPASPLANFTLPTPACGPVSITPVDSSSGNNLNYQWSVVPAAYVTGTTTANPQIDFATSINDSVVYTITLTITDSITGCFDTISRTYTVYPKPTAGFTMSTKDSCGPFTVNFVNISSPNQSGMTRADMSFFWDFHNGQTSTDSVPSVTFMNNGFNDTTYAVTLIVTNAFGCADTITDSITVHPDPTVNYTLSAQASCAPFTIDTTVINHVHHPGANSGYTWDFVEPSTGNVIQSYGSLANVSYVLSNPGDSVLLRTVAYSPFGCSIDTVETILYALGNSNPGFVASDLDGCNPLTVSFTDTSGAYTSWAWLVDGQQVSTTQNPTLTFTNNSVTNDSTYVVTMIGTSGAGCTDTVDQTITVYAGVDANFGVPSACLGDSTYFMDNSQSVHNIVSWAWDFGDGNTDTTQHPTHQYGSTGTYVITLTATNQYGCDDTYTDTIEVYPLPVADFSVGSACGIDTLCANQAFTLYDSSYVPAGGGTITSWSWDIDADGTIEYTTQNPTHTYLGPGAINIRLIVTTQYGCSDTIKRPVIVSDVPSAYFLIDSAGGCGPITTTVTPAGSGNIDTFYWEVYTKTNTGAKNIMFTSNQPYPGTIPTFMSGLLGDTTYYITHTVGNCCGMASHTDSIIVTQKPIIGVTPTVAQGCAPLWTQFSLNGPATDQTHYIIMNYGDGSVDTIYKIVQLGPMGDTNYVWSQPSHLFQNQTSSDTIYTVTVTSVNRCDDHVATADIHVYASQPVATIQATPTDGCAPLTVNVLNTSGSSISATWCLDYDLTTGTCNGPTVNGDSASYTFTNAGTYTVALFITGTCGVDTAYETITVHPVPTAAYMHSGSVCSTDTVHFTDQSTVSGTGASYFWNFGDGTTSSVQHPSHVYQSGGTYNVCMIVTSATGCIDTVCNPITIYSAPNISFTTQDECINTQPVHFYDSTSINNGQIASTLWKFGDGNTSVSANPQHTYAAPGTYTVTLIHTSSLGCTDSASQIVNIFPTPIADFTQSRSFGKACGAPQQWSFINQSTNATDYYWDFDYDGARGQNTSTNTNPGFIFTQEGDFTVLLVATNSNGCSDSITKKVVIRSNPKSAFAGSDYMGCAPFTVEFSDTVLANMNGDANIIDWVWDFGDGNTTSGSSNVTHTFTTPGTYSVSLLVENDGGCIDSMRLDNYITVFPTPIAAFSPMEINAKTFLFENFTQYVDNSTTFEWDFGDGTTSTEFEPQHRYNVELEGQEHEFTVCLRTKNAEGCADTICTPIKMMGHLLDVPNAFAPEMTGAGAAMYFLPAGHNMINYHLYIFDEWGNIIFESTSLDESGIPNEPWDGTHSVHGTELPMGAYVWKIEAKFNDGSIWKGKQYGKTRKNYGTVTLIR